MSLKTIYLPKFYNYIACFLTLDCNFKCDYCINWHKGSNNIKRQLVSGKDWVIALNRISCANDLPITLQGGEPSLHKDFIWIINNIKKDLQIDILTNLTFDVDEFISKIKPHRLERKAPYPNIRVSYHPDFMDLEKLSVKVLKLQKAGFSIGVFGLLHPKFKNIILEAKQYCQGLGLDFRTKEFLGEFNGKLYGSYRYQSSVSSDRREKCLCRTSEFLVAPDCGIFRCHHDLYKNFSPIGNLSNDGLKIDSNFKECSQFGDCNPCDVKIKNNRLQIFGHTSVEIQGVLEKGSS